MTMPPTPRAPGGLMAFIARVIRDLCLIGCGIILFVVTPPSLEAFGVYGLISNVWAAMLAVGALASLIGVVLRRPSIEVYGCCSVGFGFLVWAIAALHRPDANLTTYALSLVFLSGTAGQLYRVAMISAGRPVRA